MNLNRILPFDGVVIAGLLLGFGDALVDLVKVLAQAKFADQNLALLSLLIIIFYFILFYFAFKKKLLFPKISRE